MPAHSQPSRRSRGTATTVVLSRPRRRPLPRRRVPSVRSRSHYTEAKDAGHPGHGAGAGAVEAALHEEILVHASTFPMPLRERSIKHIIPANDFIFVINHFGYCVALNRTANASMTPYIKKNGLIWYFNKYLGESGILVYNKINDSIITVTSSFIRREYRMRAISLESIRRFDRSDSGTPVFGYTTYNMPFFDDCNSFAIITSDQEDGHLVNDIYEMNSYEFVHSISGKIHSITTRPGIMIVAYENIRKNLPIEVLSTESWTVLKKISYRMPPLKRMRFIGLCHENLLLQEHGQNMQIIDIWNNNNVTTIERSKNQKLLLSLQVNENDVLLIFENRMVVTCNSRGAQVPLEGSGNEKNCFAFHIEVTKDKNFAVMYSVKTRENATDGRQDSSVVASIDICSTFNGKSILKVNPWDVDPELTTVSTSNRHTANDRQGSAPEALKNVTTLFYDEEHHTLYTGNKEGFVHVWSN